MSKILWFTFFLGSLLSSCISHKKTVYFQDNKVNGTTITDTAVSLKNSSPYKVKPGDLLFISITSMNKEVTEFYNVTEFGEKTSYLSFYLVDESGNVTIPILGKVNVKDLSLEEVQNKILQKVRETVTDATVIVKLGTFKITVLGDVTVPGIVAIEGEKGTIFDAIALTGDIAITGDRKHVQVIREESSGVRKIIILDLTDKKIINSPDIYLRPNDIVYVEPLKAKARRDNVSQWARFVGFTSIIYIVISLFTKL
jgi:polysaccharide export outer membrane protein